MSESCDAADLVGCRFPGWADSLESSVGMEARRQGVIPGFLRSPLGCPTGSLRVSITRLCLVIWVLPAQIPELPKHNCVPPPRDKVRGYLGDNCHSPSTLHQRPDPPGSKRWLREAGRKGSGTPSPFCWPHMPRAAARGGRRLTGG